MRDFESLLPLDSARVFVKSSARTDSSSFTDRNGCVSLIVPSSETVSILPSLQGFTGYWRSINPNNGDKIFLPLFLAEAFELDPAGFSGDGDWQWGRVSSGPFSARSGTKCFATNLSGNYTDDLNSKLYSRNVRLSTDAPMLSFWHWYSFEASDWGLWDGGNVKISTDGGSSFNIIEPAGGYNGHLDDFNEHMPYQPAFGSTTRGSFWHQTDFNLMPFSDNEVWILLEAGTDNNTNEAGWYIDDFALLPRTKRPPIIDSTIIRASTDSIFIEFLSFSLNAPLSDVYSELIFTSSDTIIIPHLADMERAYLFRSVLTSFPEAESVYIKITSTDLNGYTTYYPETGRRAFPLSMPDTVPPVINPLCYRTEHLSDGRIIVWAEITDESPLDSVYLISDGRFIANGEPEGDDLYSFTIFANSLTLPSIIAKDASTRANRAIYSLSDARNTDILHLFPTYYSQFSQSGGIYIDSSLIHFTAPFPEEEMSVAKINYIDLYGIDNAYMSIIIDISLLDGGFTVYCGTTPLIPDTAMVFIPEAGCYGITGYYGLVNYDLTDFTGSVQNLSFIVSGGSTATGRGTIETITLYAMPMSIKEDYSEENHDTHKGTIFPNPSNGAFTVSIPKGAGLVITDIRGKTIRTYQNTTNERAITVYTTIDMPDGVYLVKYTNATGIIKTNKILIMR